MKTPNLHVVVAVMSPGKTVLLEIPLNQLDATEPRYFWASKAEITVFWDEDRYLAFRSLCPHMGGQLRYDKHQRQLRCSWHPLAYDIDSGLSTHCRFSKIEKFATEVREDTLLVLKGDS